MNPMPTITAAVITLNEEQHLPQLLAQLGWTDQIVIVDGGSRDATVEIARRHGCCVLEHPFDNFAAQRTRALDLATGDWVLSIDADERPTPALIREIRRQITASRHIAYRIPIRSRIFGRRMRFSGTQDDRPVRLFRRDAARWAGEVHEVLKIQEARRADAPMLARPATQIGRLNAWLEHQTLPDLAAFLAKMNRYTTLEATRRHAAGRMPCPRDAWLAPAREVFRRLIWKHGWLDGPRGWAFCLLSGLSEWVLVNKQFELAAPANSGTPEFRSYQPDASARQSRHAPLPRSRFGLVCDVPCNPSPSS
jgi:glycosyltransferase involved in cell wall biosynthesis